MKRKVSYLGDGVYATFDGEYIWLFVGSHDRPTDTAALDISTYTALLGFARRIGWTEGGESEEIRTRLGD